MTESSPHRGRLLLAEDNADLRFLFGLMLTHLGWSVDSVSDGAAAWDLLSASPDIYDVVVTDIIMPRLDGTALVERIRGEPRLEALPVLVLTALPVGARQLQLLPGGGPLRIAHKTSTIDKGALGAELAQLVGGAPHP